MRTRTAQITMITGLTLALIPVTGLTSQADPAATTSTTSGSTGAGSADPTQAVTVSLPTGERVAVSGPAGAETVRVLPTDGVPTRTMQFRRVGSRSYLIPLNARPYLDTLLDRELFDVTALAAVTRTGDELPVQIEYRAAATAVPGVTVTATHDGIARGYLTADSAPAFGRALDELWSADHEPGARTTRRSPFSGTTRITSVTGSAATDSGTVTTAATAAAAKVSVTVTVTGADGLPLPDEFGSIDLVRLDGDQEPQSREVKNGQARFSLPKGKYSLLLSSWGYESDAAKPTLRIASITDFTIGSTARTLTLDLRKATAEPSVTVPRPADVEGTSFSWTRSGTDSGLGATFAVDSDSTLALAPSKPAVVGELSVNQKWTLSEPVAEPTYTYSLAALSPSIPTSPTYTFTAADLGTVKASYYAGTATDVAVTRAPVIGGLTLLTFGGSLPVGFRRTEYVGLVGAKSLWLESLSLSKDGKDLGFIDGPSRLLPPGSVQKVSWLKGPLAPAVPTQPADVGGLCFGCRSQNQVVLTLPTIADSTTSHYGLVNSGSSGDTADTRIRLYRNGKLVSNTKNASDLAFTAPKAKTTYQAVLDVDLKRLGTKQSTRTRTELTFATAKNAGRRLDPEFLCLANLFATDCRVLPILQGRLVLPLTLDGTLPAGKSTIGLNLAQVQQAKKSPITSAKLEIRPAGGSTWKSVELKATTAGTYQGVIDTGTAVAGSSFDVRISGGDKAGSRFRQTITRGYTVAAG